MLGPGNKPATHVCPDWQSKPQRFGGRIMLEPAEPHWPVHLHAFSVISNVAGDNLSPLGEVLSGQR